MEQNLNMTVEGELLWRCLGMLGNNYHLEVRLRNLSVSGNRGQQAAPSANIRETAIRFLMSSRGIIASRKVEDDGDHLATLLADALLDMLPRLPADAVRAGDGWTEQGLVSQGFLTPNSDSKVLAQYECTVQELPAFDWGNVVLRIASTFTNTSSYEKNTPSLYGSGKGQIVLSASDLTMKSLLHEAEATATSLAANGEAQRTKYRMKLSLDLVKKVRAQS